MESLETFPLFCFVWKLFANNGCVGSDIGLARTTGGERLTDFELVHSNLIKTGHVDSITFGGAGVRDRKFWVGLLLQVYEG